MKFRIAWDATVAANQSNNRYPIWVLTMIVRLMGYRLTFYDRQYSFEDR